MQRIAESHKMKELNKEAELEKQKNDWVSLHDMRLTIGQSFGTSISLFDYARWEASTLSVPSRESRGKCRAQRRAMVGGWQYPPRVSPLLGLPQLVQVYPY